MSRNSTLSSTHHSSHLQILPVIKENKIYQKSKEKELLEYGYIFNHQLITHKKGKVMFQLLYDNFEKKTDNTTTEWI